MSATCDQCAESAFGGVTLCPLHSEAEAMKDLLIDLVGGRFTMYEIGVRASAILARIDGDTPDA